MTASMHSTVVARSRPLGRQRRSSHGHRVCLHRGAMASAMATFLAAISAMAAMATMATVATMAMVLCAVLIMATVFVTAMSLMSTMAAMAAMFSTMCKFRCLLCILLNVFIDKVAEIMCSDVAKLRHLHFSLHCRHNLGILVDFSNAILHFDRFFGAHQIQLVEDDLV
eukprot:CAMPEP_0114690244 /NCGR_PEP_ID=MMETSP0191-20121206/65469_1 /TAXON_ID=126664 /ORGANISM="Sorites sp." /LENGTH=167 /DNA_ID=CAMNT_0001979903 /DNA_START=23 /DNA_END=523 /DNA_ORIENTATION=+